MLNRYLMISTVAALLLVGCGDSDSTDPVSTSGTEITVERGPVHGALVIDANGEEATFVSAGKYRFATEAVHPITVDGGFIDVNRNGAIDVGETRLQYSLQAQQGSVVTMASTLASNSEIRTMLMTEYGLSADQIDNQTPTTDRAIAALSDEMYAYCLNNNLTPLNLSGTQVDNIRGQIQGRIDNYKGSTQSIADLEAVVMNRPGIMALGASDLSLVDQQILQSQLQDGTLLNTIPISELTDLQKEDLIFMLEEEKLARDLYGHLYTTWGVRVFTNIVRSEQRHMDTIQLLVDKYSLEAPSTETRGVFENSDLQALYDQLITKGTLSLVDALEVGVAIEETDIADLEKILAAGVPEDLKIVYTNLLNSSYKHLNAFNNMLAIYQ